jgi:hypothetical protein
MCCVLHYKFSLPVATHGHDPSTPKKNESKIKSCCVIRGVSASHEFAPAPHDPSFSPSFSFTLNCTGPFLSSFSFFPEPPEPTRPPCVWDHWHVGPTRQWLNGTENGTEQCHRIWLPHPRHRPRSPAVGTIASAPDCLPKCGCRPPEPPPSPSDLPHTIPPLPLWLPPPTPNLLAPSTHPFDPNVRSQAMAVADAESQAAADARRCGIAGGSGGGCGVASRQWEQARARPPRPLWQVVAPAAGS